MSQKRKVLISAPYFQPVVDEYRPVFDEHNIELVIPEVHERLTEEELLNCIEDIDGVICGDDRFTEKVINAAPKLKVISKWGTGIDSIDKESTAKRGIPVKRTPNAFSEPVADTVFSWMLDFARGTTELNNVMTNGGWGKHAKRALNDCVLGVVGAGDVGAAVIKRAEVFGMKVLATDIRERPYSFMVPLEQLLCESDFVSLNCDLNPTSHHLMNKEKFDLMKPTAVVINTARGPIIKEDDLIEALESGKISGAGLDVFEVEPLPLDSPLRKMPNVLLAPHNANASPAAWKRVHENTIKNLLDELNKHDTP